MEVARERVAKSPDDETARGTLATLLMRSAETELGRGGTDHAVELAREANEIASNLLLDESEDPGLLSLAAQTAFVEGDALKAKGELRGALSAYERGLQIREVLAREFPTIGSPQRFMAAALVKVGDLHQQLADFASARLSFERAFAILSRFHEERPDDPEVLGQLALLLFRLGNVRADADDGVAAVRCFEAGLSHARALTNIYPDDEWTRRMTLALLWSAGNALRALRELDRALPAYDEAVAISRKAVAQTAGAGSDYVTALSDLASSLQGMGSVHLLRGDAESALSALEESLEIGRTLYEGQQGDFAQLMRACTNLRTAVETFASESGATRRLIQSCALVSDTLRWLVQEDSDGSAVMELLQTLLVEGQLLERLGFLPEALRDLRLVSNLLDGVKGSPGLDELRNQVVAEIARLEKSIPAP